MTYCNVCRTSIEKDNKLSVQCMKTHNVFCIDCWNKLPNFPWYIGKWRQFKVVKVNE